jgi:hypothetical protein
LCDHAQHDRGGGAQWRCVWWRVGFLEWVGWARAHTTDKLGWFSSSASWTTRLRNSQLTPTSFDYILSYLFYSSSNDCNKLFITHDFIFVFWARMFKCHSQYFYVCKHKKMPKN